MSFFKTSTVCFLLAAVLLLVGCSDGHEVSQTESPSAETDLSVSSQSETAESIESTQESEEVEQLDRSYMKAVWLSQYDMSPIYLDGGKQRAESSFLSLLETVLNNVVSDGYNTIIVQVRPFADSFYPSEYFPVSSYVSGAYGTEDIYDPFSYVVSMAKERGLSVHAWLNPMRGMKVEEIDAVDDKYLIKQWYNDPEKRDNYLVAFGGRYYLNPAHEEVRKLIADGASEACSGYEIDGVHIDDYFYPTTDASFDAASYADYKQNGGTKSLADFRYDNINKMVASVYRAVKAVNPELLFGVSPAGNLNTTYTTLYTDVYTWCSEEGYLDYICPQIYFGLEHQTFDFKKVYNTWRSIIKNKNVKLYVGMTLGKAQSGIDNYAGTGKYEWQNKKDILKRCLEYLNTQKDCGGVVFFCYQYMYDPLTGKSVAETQAERENMKEALASLGEDHEQYT